MKEKLKALLVQLILTCISYFIPVPITGTPLQSSHRRQENIRSAVLWHSSLP